MIALNLLPVALTRMGERFGSRCGLNVPLGRYTAARVGGPADGLLEIQTVEELVEAVSICWREAYPYCILGGGSNVLVSDTGVRGMVIVNRARQVRFEKQADQPRLWAE